MPPINQDARATGWKIPLLFCIIMVAVVGLTAFLRTDNTPVPELPAPLFEQARAITIDLGQSPEGRAWKERISATAGGFVTRADKDIKITYLVHSAVEQQHFDAACTAAVLMYNDHKRDEALIHIAQSAMTQCATLPWAVMAAKGMKDKQNIITVHEHVSAEWQRCQTKNIAKP